MIFTIRKSSNYAVIRELAEYLQHQTFVYRAVGEILSSTEGQRTVQNMTNQNLRRMPPHQTAPHRTAPHRTSSRWSAPSGFTNIYHDLGSVLLRGALETSLPCSSPLLDSSSGKKPRQGNVYFAEDLNRYGSTVVSFYSTNRRHNVYHKTFKQWLLRLVHERKVTRYA